MIRARSGGREGGGERLVHTACDLAADGNDGRKSTAVTRHVPRAGSSHREPGDDDALRIAAELSHGCRQRRERLLLHRSIPLSMRCALRNDDDGAVATRILPQSKRQTDRELLHVVVTAFAAAVKIEDHRPADQPRVMMRQPDAISIFMPADGDASLEKSRTR